MNKAVNMTKLYDIELDSLLVALADEIREYAIVEDVVISYNYHSCQWMGMIYGELK